MLQPLVKHLGIARAIEQHWGNEPIIGVAADQAGAWAKIGVVGASHALAHWSPAPLAAGAGGKTGLVEVNDRQLSLLRFVLIFEKAFAPDVALGLEGLSVQQRFFYG